MKKKPVLFVGSFLEKAKDRSVGGQMYACKSLVGSSLSNYIDWIYLDTTGKSVPPPSMYSRLVSAIFRVFKFCYLLIFYSPSSVLIFSANGPSIYEKGFMITIAKLLGKRTIFAPRGGPLIDEIAASNFKKQYFKLIVKYSNYVICQGTFWKEYFNDLLNRNSPEKLVIIPNWIDVDFYMRLKNEGVQENLNEINILFMGWMQVEKGINDLFEALLVSEIKNYKVNMYFLGDGNQRELLTNRSILENKSTNLNFFFPGWIHGADKFAYLTKADIFVLPSYSEGMPNSLMEAMASGIACISTNVGAVSDLIDDQVNGIMYKPKDIKALTFAIEQLVGNREQRIIFGKKAAEKIYRNHSLESAVISFKRIL